MDCGYGANGRSVINVVKIVFAVPQSEEEGKADAGASSSAVNAETIDENDQVSIDIKVKNSLDDELDKLEEKRCVESINTIRFRLIVLILLR